MTVFGVDIGGSGIKGAPADLENGKLAEERVKVLTPQPSEPQAVAAAVREVVEQFDWQGPVGLTFPGVVVDGRTLTAANVDKSWIGTDAAGLFSEALGGRPVAVVNDADAAGVAEVRFGAGRDRGGVVLMLTLGTGIGSALFVDGNLVPNTELGHLELHGKDAEKHASSAAREKHELSWSQWAERLDDYFAMVEMLFSPQLIIIGGGVSRKADKFLPHLKPLRAEIVPARLQNDAGIIGAAMQAARLAAVG
ncbi:polyphosphate--glucose phosphotransferase [Streptacidiphilus jiangxiensis]|uniref:polyphosphate--glucose phosphotransferase n=1 Tax=Streptacidiphilus jiangxiensis TaxID=235985 RepID=UPI0005A6DD2E|nr:ROK family protein [Streptacidiphilus jiangxiensis]